MNWKKLNSTEQIHHIKEKSFQTPQVIFKHSTRCGTSNMVKNRLERGGEIAGVDFHFLDLITYREVSNKVAEEFDVYHESPQVLLIVKGECIYDESHFGISTDDLEEQVNKVNLN
ncbi:bacillithiol system redox-active protein YtxJ [Foetidibacter luteolus]|uniref:bacillithiol system redox-active protein YtxJ n=1 Tax=Foetidibacter luteolus TaxID=2608880 RepID=UPI00129BF098|nr:bacillithiol system redox-active protein YtxJ [Foetidibacter luteolus]